MIQGSKVFLHQKDEKEFLALPNGIPSHDTFSRVFSRLNPQQFQQCFLDWIQSIHQKQVDPLHQWSNLNSVGLVESVRTVDGKTTVETRYYIRAC